MITTAEILSVGTELLLGDIVNTDAAFLAKELAALGIACYHQSVVGDNPERLTDALKTALGRSSLILLSGGLGPTGDDLTKETAAALMGRQLCLHESSYARIRTILKQRGLPETENQKKQAMLPAGAVVFENDYGTAPGFAMEDREHEKIMILMPGPPRELEPMFREKIRPYLAAFSGQTMYSVNVGLFGIGEAAVDACLAHMMEESENPTVAPYCGEGEVRLRITARGENEEICRRMCLARVKEIEKTPCPGGTLSDYIYGCFFDDNVSIERAVVEQLTAKHLTVSFAESCTGGYLAKRITDIPGASEVLSGSFVTYSEATKKAFVGVRQETLTACSVYSEEVAIEMARGAAEKSGADIGVGITGIAGPGDGERIYHGKKEIVPAGTVYIACVYGGACQVKRCDLFPGQRNPMETREYVRRRATTHALSMVRAISAVPILQ